MSGPISIINRFIFKSPPFKTLPAYILAYDFETKEVGIYSTNAIKNPNEITKYGTIQIVDHKAVIEADSFNWRVNGIDYVDPPAYESATIPSATANHFRTDIIVGGDNVYIYVSGTESTTEAPRPPVPDGTIFLGEIPVFGDIIGEPVYTDDFVLKTNFPNRTYGTNSLGEQITYATADKENVSNKQNSLTIDGTGQKYATVDAVNAGLTAIVIPDATTTVKGIVKLANDLGGTADSPTTPTAIHKTGDETKTGNLTVNAIIKTGGTASQFLKADGSTDSNVYLTSTDVSGKEDKSNKMGTVIGNEASTTLYLHIAGMIAYFQQKLTDSIFGAFITSLTAKTTIVDADTSVVSDSTDSGKAKKVTWLNIFNYIKSKTDVDYSCACADEVSDMTVGTLITFRMPYGMTLSTIKLSLNTAPTGSKLIVDIRKNGTTILSTLVSVDTSSTTSVGAAVPYVISDSTLTDDAIITIITTQVGSIVTGKGLKVTLIGKRI